MNAKLVAAVIAFFVSACGGASTPRFSDGGAGTGGSGTAGSGAGGGSSGTSSAGTSGGGAGNSCSAGCGMARECCDGHCVNQYNDPFNCGKCGNKCDVGTYCTGGQCVTPPCQKTCGGAQCCDTACCSNGQLCCDPQGPVSLSPVCTTPVNGTCPMGCAPLCKCASPDTPIATLEGSKPIASLRVGDLVYSVDHGRITLAPIVKVNRTPVTHHSVVRVVLEGGGVLEISALHPTADGRTFGGLGRGDRLDGVDVVSATVVPYSHDATYDILPDSDSGAYFAAGVLVGSTLAADPVHVMNATAPGENCEQ